MVINNVELPDIDLADLEIAENFEKSLNDCAAKVGEVKKTENRVQLIKVNCNAVFDVFDNVFGDGTAKKVFGDKTNILCCNKALAELIDAAKRIDEENARITTDIFAKYSSVRAIRE